MTFFTAMPVSSLVKTIAVSTVAGFILGAYVAHKAHAYYKKHAA